VVVFFPTGPYFSSMTDDPVALAGDLLRAVRRDQPTTDLEVALRDLDPGVLDAALTDDGAAIAFWVNCYNAFTQLALARDPDRYDRHRFFTRGVGPVAGRTLSLDDIEHRILRRGHVKWGLGYVRWPFGGTFLRRMRPTRLDPRIHFALNCGAASCPPIAAYTAAGIDEELDLATASYLGSEVEYDPATNIATVPRLMLWFRGDFGGKGGILDVLREFDCIPADASPSLSYREYDWELRLRNYRQPVAAD
jgi:hypothetical protein